MTQQVSPWEVPELVGVALRESLRAGYVDSTRSETGRFLATLAASCRGVIADLGTGGGVGAAWLRSGACETTRVVTVEQDEALIAPARELFRDHRVEVLHGDWSTMDWATHDIAEFSLITVDLGTAKGARDRLITLLEPGGFLVLDDLQAATLDGRANSLLRQSWLHDQRMVCCEVRVAEDATVLLATKR